MFSVIRKRIGLVVAGLLAALCPMLMAPSGGFPSTPTFQQITAASTAGRSCPGFSTTNTTSACFTTNVSGHSNWAAVVSPQGGSLNELGLLVTGGGAAIDQTDTIFRVDGGNVAGAFIVDGLGGISELGADATFRNSSITITFATAQIPNCTATGTNSTLTLHRAGKIVVASVGGTAGTCTTTGGTTNLATTNTPVPVGFRPATATQCGSGSITNSVNPGGMPGFFCVSTSGNLQFFSLPATGATSMGILAGGSFYYTLD